MSTPTFAWLGSKRSRKYDVAPKGRLLDMAARRGLPVPNGAILLDELYRLLLTEGVIQQKGNRIVVPAPDWLRETIYESVRLPRLERPCAIRTAFSSPEETGNEQALNCPPRLWVDVTEPDQLAEALSAVWSEALPLPDEARRDVLLMEMVAAQTDGVALADDRYQDDLIIFTPKGSAGAPEKSLSLPRLLPGERPSPHLLPFARRLQQLLRGVRRTCGGGQWRVSWADDGRVCWLLGVQPLTESPPRNEAFTPLLIKPILSDSPSPLLTGIITAAAPQIFAHFRQFDPDLPADRPLIEVFGVRPWLNVTLLRDVTRAWGLPPSLVDEALGVSLDEKNGFRPGRMLRKSIPLFKYSRTQIAAASRAQRTIAEMSAHTETPPSFNEAIDVLRYLLVRLGRETLTLAAARSACRLLSRRGGPLTGPARRRQRRLERAWEKWQEQALLSYRNQRQQVEALAETAVAQEQLPSVAAIWLLHPNEVQALDEGAIYDAPFITAREEAWQKAQLDRLPRLIHRFDDLAQYRK